MAPRRLRRCESSTMAFALDLRETPVNCRGTATGNHRDCRGCAIECAHTGTAEAILYPNECRCKRLSCSTPALPALPRESDWSVSPCKRFDSHPSCDPEFQSHFR